MEVENQTPSEISENPAPVDGTPSAPTDGAPAPDAGAPALNADGTPATPAWTPDFKFKVMDKEHEIDPIFRPIIKDEETLKKVRRMQEQVLGLPHLEASRDEFKTKYQTALPRLQEYEVVEKRLGKLSHLVQNKDFGTFFDMLKIPRAEVLRWVKQELDADQLPPEVRQEMERARQLNIQKWDAEQELNHYRSQEQQNAYNQAMMQVDQVIMHSAGDVATQFNTRMNEPLAFRNAVINKGAAIQQATGQKPPLDQVINMVKADLARVMGIVEGGAPAAQPTPGAPAQAQAKPPVIPAVKGGSASPVKTGPKSIADLRKLANEMT
jgi:hypothetical protein